VVMPNHVHGIVIIDKPEFRRQSRFHDHIIRNDTEYQRHPFQGAVI